MKIIAIAPLTLTVELDPTDCLALADAAAQVARRNETGADGGLNNALAAALINGAFGAFLLAGPDKPHTLRHMWAMWAPLNGENVAHERIPIPAHFAPRE